ncbi:MAG: polysaccharide biosynthesis protein [Eubacteriaceae bacterium]|nr:polysaccharide biosynthesis protein [Eubacteriaceae bacterium]
MSIKPVRTKRTKQGSFLSGAAALAVGGVFAKFLGMFFRVPIANILGDVGFGYYTLAYQWYSAFLSLSTIGLPLAVSKLVSERASVGNYKGTSQVLSLATRLLASLGLIASLAMLLGARAITEKTISESYYSFLFLSPAPLAVALLSAYRGYLQGMQRMAPTSVSQIIEQALRVAVGVGLAYWAMGNSSDVALAAGLASSGATAGAVAALAYMAVIAYSHNRQLPKEGLAAFSKEPNKGIYATLLSIALPIAIGSLVTSSMGIINSVTVINGLRSVGFSHDTASSLFGALDGKAQTLVNVPFVLGTSLSTSLVPAISAALAQGDRASASKMASLALKLSLLISLPASVGLSVLSEPIMALVFGAGSRASAPLLASLAYVTVFTVAMTALQGILQGAGRMYEPIVNMTIGVSAKLFMNIILIKIPSINIYGAIASSIAASAIIFVLNLISTVKHVGIKGVLAPTAIAAVASAVMGVCALASFRLFERYIGEKLACIAAIPVAIAVYAAIVVLAKAVTIDELSSMRG